MGMPPFGLLSPRAPGGGMVVLGRVLWRYEVHLSSPKMRQSRMFPVSWSSRRAGDRSARRTAACRGMLRGGAAEPPSVADLIDCTCPCSAAHRLAHLPRRPLASIALQFVIFVSLSPRRGGHVRSA